MIATLPRIVAWLLCIVAVARETSVLAVEQSLPTSTWDDTYFTNISNEDTYLPYLELNTPIAYLFTQSVEKQAEVRQALTAVAISHKHDINFVFVDPIDNVRRAKWLNVDLFTETGPQDWPAMVIREPQTRHKYPYASPGGVNLTDLPQFIDKYFSGQANQSVRSQPVPEQDSPMTTVVADNFDAVVLDNDKDVLIEFYDPECRPCKRLAPIWEALAAVFVDEPSIVIAKVNERENDVPDEIMLYPTIKLFRAGQKLPTVDYGGEPTLDDLVSFIQENAVNKPTSIDKELVLRKSPILEAARIRSMQLPAHSQSSSANSGLRAVHEEL